MGQTEMIDYEKQNDGKIVFKLKKELYPLDVIYRTAYLFLERCYIGLDEDAGSYLVKLSPKDGSLDDRTAAGEFQNELLNQCVRAAVSEETGNIRKLIVTRALYSAFIPEEPAETEAEGEYHLDEIAKAWYDDESTVTE